MSAGPSHEVKPTSKGKSRVIQHDFTDLNPTITYRHILSQNLGVKDPLRVIALCDSDAFYAACEMVRLGVDNETPLVVLQWDSLIAVNYAARTYGISRMIKKKEALQKCPHLKVVHVATYKEGEKEPGYWDEVDTNTHKVSLDYYRRESMKIAGLFKEILPGCEIEKASIDEAFIDFTKPVREILFQRYPYLAQVPPGGVDTPLPPPPPMLWEGHGHLIPVNPPPTPPSPPALASGDVTDEVDEADKKDPTVQEPPPGKEGLQVGEDDDSTTTWHDVALSIAAEIMDRAREEVLIKLGYSTSAGIARNKFLAKLTASYRKPNSQSILRNAAIPNYLMPMKFQKIRFLGGKLGEALAKKYDASTVGDLLTINLNEMQSRFGEESIWVYEVLRGIDRAEVKDKGSNSSKSMLASKNLPKPITKASEGHHWIRVLAAELALRLNNARKISPNLWPKSIVLHARKGQIYLLSWLLGNDGNEKGYESGRSKQAPFPFTREVTVDNIAVVGDRLWKDLVGNASTMNVSTVQLAFTGIDVAEAGLRSIEGFLKVGQTSKRPREEADTFDNDRQGPTARVAGYTTDANGIDGEDPSRRRPSISYTCARCGKKLCITEGGRMIDDANEEESVLAALKMEHDDFHFAQDLAREGEPAEGGVKKTIVPGSGMGVVKAKKRRKEPVGIEKFFGRK